MEQRKYTPEEEKRMIDEAFQDLLDGYLNSNHRKKVEIIKRAFDFANEAHKGVRRRSGEPYILHPIAVARIASQEIGLGSTSICAALLHDVVEDTDYTVDDIENIFGEKIAQIVNGLTKISGGIFGDNASAQAENFRKLLLTMPDDIRVILIKMADRLHNMRTLGSMAPNKQYKIAGETLYIYAPLAHRLGLFAIKTELEDLSFKYEHPDAYKQISDKLKASEEQRTEIYKNFSTPIKDKLKEKGFCFEVKARMKSVYSIWNKMKKKNIPFEEVYDLYAVRIIFDCDDLSIEKSQCWNIYSIITDLYRLHPERTRDWVSNPKANGYQALHLTVMGPDGNWVEVQIRSRRMDDIAEKGFAAHWKYKIGESDEESELNMWIKTIRDILDDPNPSAIDFLGMIRLNLFATEIVVFTPKGKNITMPSGSTVLDMAYELHSEIGNHCIAGKVNHKLVPLSQKLNSGDQVEVLTSQSQTPQAEWLKYLATAKAKTRLRAALRKTQQPLIDKGKKLYTDFLSRHNITDSNEVATKIIGLLKLANREDLYHKLGNEEIVLEEHLISNLKKSSPSILSKLFRIGSNNKEKNISDKPKKTARKINRKETYILRHDGDEVNFNLKNCCRPIPGDDVMGYVEDDNTVTIHSLDCPRAQMLKASYGQNIVATRWETTQAKFLAQINIDGIDRMGILQELIQMISTILAIDIRSLNIKADNEVFHCELSVHVEDTKVVTDLCEKVKKINGVKNASRIL